MSDITESELIDIGSRIAQELQEFIDEAEQAGCSDPLPGTKALIDEWEDIYNRTDNWRDVLQKQEGKVDCGIAALK